MSTSPLSNTKPENSFSSVQVPRDVSSTLISGTEVVQRRLSALSLHLGGKSVTKSLGDMSQGKNNEVGRKKDKVVVCRDLGEKVMPLLYSREDLEVVVWPEDRGCERPWLLEKIKGAAGVILVLAEKVDIELLEAAGPSLRAVSTMSVGHEHIDKVETAKRGIRVGYTPDVLTDAVADISVMLALMASRNVGETLDLVNRGLWPSFTWSPWAFVGPQMSATSPNITRTVGFLGFGRIAKATLARLVPFGVTHCIYSASSRSKADPVADENLAKQLNLKGVRRVDFDELASQSDVLFVLAPGGAETRHLINEDFLKKMKKSAILVNTARGTLVDSDALAKALRERWIFAAGVDVVEGEPNVDQNHPLVKEPKCVVLPHIGSATLETRLAMATLAVNNLLAALDGKPMPAALIP